jgi:hypothetical protein
MISKEELFEKFDIITGNANSSWYEMLSEAFAYEPFNNAETNKRKAYLKYFYNYLFNDSDGLKARLILIEKDYTSQAYLSDYMNYYATCYRNYSKQCRRIHFFEQSFTKEYFVEMIVSDDDSYKEVWDSYLGYVVIKPLPTGIIGTTLIKTYSDKEKRFFTSVRNYHVNLFGKRLSINTLPYQEQDGVVGSCASSALWFAFQKTGHLFKTAIPNPGDITIAAGYDSFHTGKSFPSTGLEVRQICKAILSTGLMSELRFLDKSDISDCAYLKSFVYAYLKMGIPVLLGLEIEDNGSHLVTLNGYRFSPQDNAGCVRYDDQLFLKSDEIIKLYAHDDQIGPFARLDFLHDQNTDFQFNTSWWKDVASDLVSKAKVFCIIVPVKNSIKVTFDDIEEEVYNFEYALLASLGNNSSVKIVWDIFLTGNNEYKDEIRTILINDVAGVYDPEAIGVLFESLPQYIWVAKAFLKTDAGDFLLFDLIYDAIDVNFKSNPYSANIYDKAFKEVLEESEILGYIKVFKKYYSDSKTTLTGQVSDLFEEINTLDPIDITVKQEGETESKPASLDSTINKLTNDTNNSPSDLFNDMTGN